MSRPWTFALAVPFAIATSSVLALIISPPDLFMFSIYYGAFLGISAIVLVLVFRKSLRRGSIGEQRGMTIEKADKEMPRSEENSPPK